jgi:hypothetical protein
VYMLKKVAGVSLGLQYETQKAVAAMIINHIVSWPCFRVWGLYVGCVNDLTHPMRRNLTWTVPPQFPQFYRGEGTIV